MCPVFGVHYIPFFYVPSNYSGIYNQQIRKTVLRYITQSEWESSTNKWGPSATEISKPKPRIGMTAEEVRNSYWGTPNKINRTTTEYSVREQWVYTNQGYIYLDDGIVTAIQD